MGLLPTERYEFATWKVPTVNIDYHVELDCHYYSVPYQTGGQEGGRQDDRSGTIEVFSSGKRVASHLRSYRRWHHTTDPAHMPESTGVTPPGHRHGSSPGPRRPGRRTAELVTEIMASRPHPEQGFRSALGIIRLGDRFGVARVEAACTRALAVRSFSYRSVESILKHDLDRQPLPGETSPRAHPPHHNVRGPDYYH